MKLKDVTGRISRTMTTAHLIMIVGTVQAVLSVSGLPIPPEYQWANGVALAVLGPWLAYLRMHTKTPMQ